MDIKKPFGIFQREINVKFYQYQNRLWNEFLENWPHLYACIKILEDYEQYGKVIVPPEVKPWKS